MCKTLGISEEDRRFGGMLQRSHCHWIQLPCYIRNGSGHWQMRWGGTYFDVHFNALRGQIHAILLAHQIFAVRVAKLV
jgi:hypothetical protein